MEVRIISWNIARSAVAWEWIASGVLDADVALLQEAVAPLVESDFRCFPGSPDWSTAGGSRRFTTAVVVLNSDLVAEPVAARPLSAAAPGDLGISRMGTISAVTVTTTAGEELVVASVYAPWEKPIEGSWIVSDASAHRVVSDLSLLVGRQVGHRIIAAGDLNILNGYGENGSDYWGRRYSTVFDRMDAIGLPFVGPQQPNGRPAAPHPAELPESSRDVPTFRTRRDAPETATRQLDFVFASREIARRVRTRALNGPDEWGPSDHCRVVIDFPEGP